MIPGLGIRSLLLPTVQPKGACPWTTSPLPIRPQEGISLLAAAGAAGIAAEDARGPVEITVEVAYQEEEHNNKVIISNILGNNLATLHLLGS